MSRQRLRQKVRAFATLLALQPNARWDRILWPALSVGGLIVLWATFQTPGPGFDFYAYWAVDPAHPYDRMFEPFNAFRYGPPLIWLAGPLKLLPFTGAYWVWFLLEFGTLVFLTGRWALAWLLFLPVPSELFHGNIHLLLAGVLVAGFRWPSLWAFLPVSKVTSGVVVLYPALRRSWRTLASIVFGLLILVVVSAILTPRAWPDWLVGLLGSNNQRLDQGGDAAIRVPLLLRLAISVAIVVWSAKSGRRWPLAIALVLSLPQLWIHGLSILVAIPRLRSSRDPQRDLLHKSPPPATPDQLKLRAAPETS